MKLLILESKNRKQILKFIYYSKPKKSIYKKYKQLEKYQDNTEIINLSKDKHDFITSHYKADICFEWEHLFEPYIHNEVDCFIISDNIGRNELLDKMINDYYININDPYVNIYQYNLIRS